MNREGTKNTKEGMLALCLGVVFALACPLGAADCNLNDVEDGADVLSALSDDCNGNLVPDECEFSLVGFGIGEGRVALTADPRGLVVADFSGEGFDDVAAIYREGAASKLSVALSRGDRTFEPQTIYEAGRSISYVTTADLDLDGDVDIVTANSTELLVFKNRGDGVFEPPESVETTRLTRFVAAADVTGDGLPELLTVNNSSDRLVVFAGEGGTFSLHQETFVGDLPVFVAAADFDADGDNDLVILESDTNEVVIYDNPGSGRFSGKRSFPTGNRPSALHIEDFDGDLDLDVVTINSTDTSLLLNRGDGSFDEPVEYALLARAMGSADFDGDGHQEVVLFDAKELNLRVLAGDGGRLGTAGILVNLPRSVVDLGLGDLDGDGDADIVFSSSTPTQLDVFWNSSGIPLSFEKTVAPNSTRPHSGTVQDFNGDGFLDVITANGNNNMNYSILLGRGDVVLLPAVDVPIPVSPTALAGGGRSDLNFLTSADVEGDGDFDLAIVDRSWDEIVLLYNRGDGTFDEWAFLPTADSPFAAVAADLNGDGAPDFATANQIGSVSVILNQGDGTFAPGAEFAVGSQPLAVKAADFDRDGDQDIVTANNASSDLSVLLNPGDGSLGSRLDIPIAGAVRSVIPGDFNRDGFADLATANVDGKSVSVVLNQGDATFSPPTDYPIDEFPYSVGTADLNSDGLLDVFTANEASGTLSILVGNGDGTFQRRVNFSTGPETGSGPRYAMTGDFDGDADTDLISLNRNSAELTFFRNSLGGLVAKEDFLDAICTVADFQSVSVPVRAGGSESATKYLVPVGDGPESLPVLFQNVQRFALQSDFLTTVFPKRFPQLSSADYNRLVGVRERREYFAGSLREFRDADGLHYAFTVVIDASDPAELLSAEEVRGVAEKLSASFLLEPLCYLPEGRAAREQARAWGEPGFAICFSEEVAYEVYTPGVAYGRVRILSPEAFAEASARRAVTFQDILVLEDAPADVETPFAAVFTGETPEPLSPLAVSTSQQGTPHALVADAMAAFEPFADKLVRVEVREVDFEIREATPQEALEFWGQRAQLSVTPRADDVFSELPTLLEIAELDLVALEDPPGVARFGGRTQDLARLALVLEGSAWSAFAESGFGIPTRYFLEFARSGSIGSAVDPARQVSYEEYLLELLANLEFRTDSRFRREALEALGEAMRREGPVDPELVTRLGERAGEVLGAQAAMGARFRSAANLAETVEFRSVGLGEAGVGCAADDLDDDSAGPSHCDAASSAEQTIAQALKNAWADVWSPRAYEEREFFGVPQEQIAAAVLVTPARGEAVAHGVAFTGHPGGGQDRRYFVAAQVGEATSEGLLGVSASGAEQSLLEIVDGVVGEIVRAESSTQLAAGDVVLSDAQLTEVGGLLAFVDANYPIELNESPRQQVLLEIAFQVLSGGELAIDQLRPFLLGELAPTPEFQIEIPVGTEICGVFGLAGAKRGPQEEYAFKSTIRWHGGTVMLPGGTGTFRAELFDEVRFGPERQVAVAISDGEFRVQTVPRPDGMTLYRFTYEQEFALEDGRSLVLAIVRPLSFVAQGNEPLDGAIVLDEEFFTAEPGGEAVQAVLDGEPLLRYGSCAYTELPRFEIVAELEDGATFRVVERFSEASSASATGPASLVRAEFSHGDTSHVETDYFRLIYSAFRHNTAVRYWMIFEPSLELPDVAESVYAVELFDERENLVDPEAPLERRAAYLGENFEVLREVPVASFRKGTPAELPRFRRGDVNADGSVAIDDAIGMLEYLFRRGTVPDCRKTADVDDDGRTNLADAIVLLTHLFRPEGPPLHVPFLRCDVDPTPDDLSCDTFAPCESQ